MRLSDITIWFALRDGKRIAREADQGQWWIVCDGLGYIKSGPHNRDGNIICMMLDDITADDWCILED